MVQSHLCLMTSITNYEKIKSKKIYRSLNIREKQQELKNEASKNIINYHINERCNTSDSIRTFNPCTRGCLAAIYAVKSINTNKIIDLPKNLALPYFITQANLSSL
jgi:hypothetical protein